MYGGYNPWTPGNLRRRGSKKRDRKFRAKGSKGVWGIRRHRRHTVTVSLQTPT